MCGIAGFYEASGFRGQEESVAQSMADAIAHRGPDDHGIWVDAESQLVLAHRRLAVVDLSPQGHQPMISASGRYVVTFNGEVYNFIELRQTLERAGLHTAGWRGHSDTEVLLAAFDAWGIEHALREANGMFALAVFDRSTRTLVLARDRFGEKPLYYGWQGNTFLFASELKALIPHPSFRKELNATVIPSYLRFGYVPAPYCIYAGISKLGPGEWFELPLTAGRVAGRTGTYWKHPLPAPDSHLDEHTAIDELDRVLRKAVAIRMQADVPLGTFLSGGIDSSAIVAIAQAQSAQPIRTFSIGFRQGAHDESVHARAVANALGAIHTEMFVEPTDALDVVPSLAGIYDEPFADSSQIPTHLLAKLTRQHVTVALSGDGGDELFGGYYRHFYGQRLERVRAILPRSLRAACARVISATAGETWDRMLAWGPRSAAVQLGSDRLSKLAHAIALDDIHAAYRRVVSHWNEPTQLLGVSELASRVDDVALRREIECPIAWMMYMDQLTYLPNDILTKVDRATMACALEVRVPFLDPNVAQFAATLPLKYKLRGSTGKWLLRRLLARYLDSQMFRRPKQGFAIPLDHWLRGPLREWAEDLLSERALRETIQFRTEPIRLAWRTHLEGRANFQQQLWTVLMYQMWHRQTNPRIV